MTYLLQVHYLLGRLPVRACPTLQCALAIAVASPVHAQVGSLRPADFAVGGVSPGIDSSDVRAMLGSPDSVQIDMHAFDVGAELVTWHYAGLQVHYHGNAGVAGLTLLDSHLSTSRGLRVGNAAAEVRRLYGEPEVQYEGYLDFIDPAEPSGMHLIRVRIAAGEVVSVFLGWVLD